MADETIDPRLTRVQRNIETQGRAIDLITGVGRSWAKAAVNYQEGELAAVYKPMVKYAGLRTADQWAMLEPIVTSIREVIVNNLTNQQVQIENLAIAMVAAQEAAGIQTNDNATPVVNAPGTPLPASVFMPPGS